MISVTIATQNFRFLYNLKEILSDIKEIKTNHILPSEPVPKDSDVIITTEIEKNLIANSKNVFIPKTFNVYYLYSNICLIKNEKEAFEDIIIGIDPGETSGIAVIANKTIILRAAEFYNTTDIIREIISVFFNIETENFVIKIGSGGGETKLEIIKKLDKVFHGKIPIRIIKEDFTSKKGNEFEKSKYTKNMISAILIAKK